MQDYVSNSVSGEISTYDYSFFSIMRIDLNLFSLGPNPYPNPNPVILTLTLSLIIPQN